MITNKINIVREFLNRPEKGIKLLKTNTRENLNDEEQKSVDDTSINTGWYIALIIILIILFFAIIVVVVRLCRNQYRGMLLIWAVLFISPIPLIGSNGIGPLGCLILVLFMRTNNKVSYGW